MCALALTEMSTTVIDLGDLTDWLAVGVNAAGFVVGIAVLLAAKRNVDALLLQMRSQSSQALIEAHKTLFLPLIQDRKLADIASGGAGEEFQKRMLASVMINHASRIFYEINSRVIPDYDPSIFRDDLLDLFALPIVAARWPQVQAFHRAEFVKFVEEALAQQADIAVGDAAEAAPSSP